MLLYMTFHLSKRNTIWLIYHAGNKMGNRGNVGKRKKKSYKKKDESKNLQPEGN